VVGVLGIIFSSLGIFGAGQEIMMPSLMKFQRQMFSTMTTAMEREAQRAARRKADAESPEESTVPDDDNAAAAGAEVPVAMFKSMQQMWAFPEWYGMWSVISGMIKLVLCGLYLFASIAMLQTKPFSIPLFYAVAGACVVLGLAKAVMAISTLSFMAMGMMMSGMFGAVIDLVLIMVVATGDKEVFTAKAPPPLPA